MRTFLSLSVFVILFFGCGRSEKSVAIIDNPSSENSSFPSLYTDNTGLVFMSWIELQNASATLKYATFLDGTWSVAHEIASDSTWFINWADFPSIIGHDGKPLAAHWLRKIPGNAYSYNIELTAFQEEWSQSNIPHKDNTATEHGFVSMKPASDSTFLAVWLDGRNTDGRAHHEYSDLSKAMTLRGAFLDVNAEVLESFELDAAICDCCNTSISKTESGFIAAYRDRTAEEIRDIKVIKYQNGTWQEPMAVFDDNWEIAACPVNGPAIASYKSNVAVAWFSGADGDPVVKMSLSVDNGDTFHKPIIIDENNPVGRVDLTFIEDKIWLSWISNENDEASLRIHQMNLDGETIAEYSIDDISASRGSGFPQISTSGDNVLIAYTNIEGDEPAIKTAIIQ